MISITWRSKACILCTYIDYPYSPHAWRDWMSTADFIFTPGFNSIVEVVLFVLLRRDNTIQNTACGNQLHKSVNIICNSAISCILLKNIRFILIFCQMNCSKWTTSLSYYFFHISKYNLQPFLHNFCANKASEYSIIVTLFQISRFWRKQCLYFDSSHILKSHWELTGHAIDSLLSIHSVKSP